MKNVFKILIVMMINIFYIDVFKVSLVSKELYGYVYLLNSMIAKSYGLNKEIMNFVTSKNIIIDYPETNSNKKGDIVTYTIYKEFDLCLIKNKVIEVDSYVILGSAI